MVKFRCLDRFYPKTPKRPNGLYMKCFVNVKLVCDTPVFKSAHMLVKPNAKSNINQILLNMQNNADVSISANTCNSLMVNTKGAFWQKNSPSDFKTIFSMSSGPLAQKTHSLMKKIRDYSNKCRIIVFILDWVATLHYTGNLCPCM